MNAETKRRQELVNRIHNLVIDFSTFSEQIDNKYGEDSKAALLHNDVLTYLEKAYSLLATGKE